jgi:hypothetical protein
MADYRASSRTRRFAAIVALSGLIATAPDVSAQNRRRWEPLAQIPSGTTVEIRTTQPISSNAQDGRIYQGIVDADVLDTDGRLAIENGSTAELMVRRVDGDELLIDLESVTVNGRRYAVRADSQVVGTGGRRGIDINRETGEYAAGGAVLGAIIGAVTGGKKGAAIGAGVGAAAGAGTQIATRGRTIDVPAEALLSYRLTRPLNLDVDDTGFDRDGVHYHRWR